MARMLSAATLLLFTASLSMAQATPGDAAASALQQANRFNQLQQLQEDQRFKANPDVPTGQRLLADYGGYISFNYLSLDDSSHNNHGLRQTELVGYARFNLDGAQEVFLRARTDYNDYNSGDSFDGFGSRLINPDFDRAYYRFDLQKAQGAYGSGPGPIDLTAQVGRDLNYWANGLVLTQVLDGGKLTLGTPALSVEGICGVTPTRTVDIDTSRPDFDHNTRRIFFGAMASAQVGDHRPFFYALAQKDENNKDVSVTGPITTRFDYDSYYLGAGSTGNLGDRLRYGVEGAWEYGTTLSNSFSSAGGSLFPVIQTNNHISAWATDIRLDYLIQDPHQIRASAELILASGDHNRGTSTNTFDGSKPKTTDHGFNAFGLLNTGLAFSPDVSNLIVERAGISAFPLPNHPMFRRMQAGFDFFAFEKFLEDAPIDETSSGGTRYLGVEPDVYVNWQIVSDLTLALRYGAFFPNKDALGSDAQVRQFFYGGLTLAF
jgi:hypothetical protein